MSTEYLTIDQFASRMQISRSTAYNWLVSGHLELGIHYLRIGGIIRILWGEDLLKHLLEQSASIAPHRPALSRKGTGGKNRCALDAEYLQAD